MSKARAPGRVNFAGGGTEIEPYLSDYGGYVLSAAIKVYCRAVYEVGYKPQNEIERIISEMAGQGGVRLANDCYPASGLGGSASMFVAGIKVVYPLLENEQIARLAFYLERKVMGIPGGKQDQYCAAFGGFNFMVFEGDKVEINRLEMPENLARLLVLVYTGRRSNESEKIIVDQLTRYNVKALHHQKQIAKAMRDCVAQGDIIGFAQLLDDAWRCKREFSPLVATEAVDNLHERCLSLGAIAGSIMGAGGGGYMLMMENPNGVGDLRQNLLQNGIHYQNVEIDENGVVIE